MKIKTPTIVAAMAVALLCEAKDKERLNVNWSPTVQEAQAFADSVVYDPQKGSETTCKQPFLLAGGYEPFVYTPLCRIEQMSVKARQEYETLTVTEETLPFSGFEVVAYPPTGTASSFGYKLVILKSTDRALIVKPEEMEKVPVPLTNKMGYEAEFNSVVARFTPEQIGKVQAADPKGKGEFYIVTVNDLGGERECKLKTKHFKHLH